MTSEKGAWPENVGIIAMEIYFPSQYVDQEGIFTHIFYFALWSLAMYSQIYYLQMHVHIFNRDFCSKMFLSSGIDVLCYKLHLWN